MFSRTTVTVKSRNRREIISGTWNATIDLKNELVYFFQYLGVLLVTPHLLQPRREKGEKRSFRRNMWGFTFFLGDHSRRDTSWEVPPVEKEAKRPNRVCSSHPSYDFNSLWNHPLHGLKRYEPLGVPSGGVCPRAIGICSSPCTRADRKH